MCRMVTRARGEVAHQTIKGDNMKWAVFFLLLSIPIGCTWRDTAKVTANAAVYSAMIATGNAGDWNMNADLACQAAEGFMDLAIDSANGTSSDMD